MIDIEKFICSLLADHPVGVTAREDVHKALKDQGLEYKDGKIVPIADKNSLAKSGDEKVKKGIKSILKHYAESGEVRCPYPFVSINEALTWLEKQGEQKLADKVSLNFKKGDILYEQKTMSILLVYERNGNWLMTFCDYWILKEKLHMEFPYEKYGFVQEMSLVPATKEQCDLLFQKMKEAGYEWNAEKKELKMIEQTPTWSEDDENVKQSIIDILIRQGFQTQVNWLKDRIQPQPQQEWSKEDEEVVEALNEYVKNLDIFFSEIKINGKNIAAKEFREKVQDWLKSLKERYTWKPSDEQMEFLKKCIEAYNEVTFPTEVRVLSSLYNDLKKLKG